MKAESAVNRESVQKAATSVADLAQSGMETKVVSALAKAAGAKLAQTGAGKALEAIAGTNVVTATAYTAVNIVWNTAKAYEEGGLAGAAAEAGVSVIEGIGRVTASFIGVGAVGSVAAGVVAERVVESLTGIQVADRLGNTAIAVGSAAIDYASVQIKGLNENVQMQAKAAAQGMEAQNQIAQSMVNPEEVKLAHAGATTRDSTLVMGV